MRLLADVIYQKESQWNDKNTIHLRFEEGEESSNQLIEFTQSDGYVERVFDLEKVVGKRKVTFIFLPGSQFDFGWFRFE
jgi:beta-galactosidase